MDHKSPSTRAKKIRVIVTDDDPVMRSLIVAKLMKRAEEIVEAVDGQDAWRRMTSETFDLALVDLSMPGLDGLSLIQCMRGHRRTRHMPIVVITSNNDKASIDRALEVGATSFLTKPLNWTLFDTHLDYLIRLSGEARIAHTALAEAEAVAREMKGHLARVASMAEAGLTSALKAELAALSKLCDAIDKPAAIGVAEAIGSVVRDHAA
jgi:CheY-like chemotaxis protein